MSDSSGAVVPNAHIFVVNKETNAARLVITASDGEFHVLLLQPGNYSVLVDALGFQQTRVPSVPVVVSETVGLKLTVTIGPVTAHVQVTESPELAQRESSALGRATSERTINALPLANRNYSQILALSPGVLVELPNAAALGRNNQNVSANGAKTTANNFQFNGIDANNLSENSASGFGPEVGIAIPAPDAISQFKVQTGNYDAGYGRGSGANVDVISKSGSTRLHGDLWEFFRNDALNANDFFLKRNGQRRPDLKQNQFGFTLGGPVPKTKTFFFGSYQATTQRDGDSSVSLQSAFLPQLTKDRSAATLGAAFCAANHPQDPFYQTAGGGLQVACDGSNISPVALGFLQFKYPDGSYAIPTPQQLLPGGIGRSVFSIPARYREDQFSVNLDRTLFTNHQLAGRFFYSHAPTTEPFSPFGANLPGWGTAETDQNQMFVLSDTYIIKPDLINVARFGFIRFNGDAVIAQPIRAVDVGMATPSGLPETPGLAINGLFTIGTAGEPFYYQNTNTFVWQDTLSFTTGRHNFRMGAEAKRHQLALNVPFITDGFLFFLSFPDFLLGESAAQNGSSTSNIFQSIGASGLFRKDERYSDFAGFFQDDIKISPRLTVNAGLRYEIFGAPSEINGRLPDFDPTIASAQVPSSGSFSGFTLPANYRGPLPAGVLKTNGSGLWRPDYSDLGPRFGFSLQLSDRPTLLLRGGYGIYYERLSGQLAEQSVGQPPFSLKQSLQGAENAGATLQQPYNPTLPPNSSYPIFIPRTSGGALSLAAISPHLTSPYTQQYNLNIQYEFAPDLLWQVGYVGAITSHLAGCTQFNQAFLASPQNPVNGETTNTIENLVQRLPFAGIAEGSYLCNTTFSANYNSLQTSVTRRLSHGLEFLGSYTFSKNIDYTSGTGGLSNFDLEFLSNDQRNPRQARGLNDFDRTHRFVVSFVYQPPKLRSGPSLLQHALSGWQFSGLAVAQTGVPITVIDSTAGSIYGNLTGFSRAQCTGVSPASSGSTYNRLNGYFNPAAFAPAPVIGDGTGFGSCGVGILRGPGQRNMDAAIQRDIAIKETSTLQFRTEFFNLTNTPNFGPPVNDFAAGPAFGVISSTVSNPRIIQFALKYKF
ncbi:MAG: carboxypeptidase regulatory-like domain-containing protein [Acidobacteriaceae bacterium]